MGGRALTVDWARAEHTVSAEIMKTATAVSILENTLIEHADPTLSSAIVANLFIRNIAPGTSEYALKQLFGAEEAGVARVKIQRTYGFIRFHKRAQAEAATGVAWKSAGLVLLLLDGVRRGHRQQGDISSCQFPSTFSNIQFQRTASKDFLRQIEAPLFTPPVLDMPLLTPANTPVANTPGPSSLLPALPIAYFAPSPALPIHATPVADQSTAITVRSIYYIMLTMICTYNKPGVQKCPKRSLRQTFAVLDVELLISPPIAPSVCKVSSCFCLAKFKT
ncbi:hypothetical protein ANCDUO_25136 [Ancylostoma duodenale]|uniref:RRM domain-containing protein n=1 Tax=Ancylostoma duodenale TaxID=51022 RepID=A0A0C2C577_9BILA|nr:hypothetical protein ANCDUO_25136 [Ancylostoma duodenale]